MLHLNFTKEMVYHPFATPLAQDENFFYSVYRSSVLSPNTGYANSKYRRKPGKAKLSESIVALIGQYAAKRLCILINESDHGIYYEVQTNKTTYSLYATEKKVQYEASQFTKDAIKLEYHIDLAIWGAFLWEIFFGKNDELKELWDSFNERLSKGGAESAFSDKESIIKMCDSFYVYWAMEQPQLERVISDDLKILSLKMAINNEALAYPKNDDESHLISSYIKEASVIELSKEAQKKGSTTKTMSLVDACLQGLKTVRYKWTEEQKAYIPDRNRLKDFIEIEQFAPILNKLYYRLSENVMHPENASKNFVNLTLTGKPGTGKTNLVYALGAALGIPVYTTACSQNTDEDEFLGMTKFVAGKPTPVETDAVKAFKNGGILLLEEVNLTPPAVIMGALGQGVEFPYIIKEDGYKPVHRHPLCVIISTMNVGTAGSKIVSQPFANRFKQSYVLSDPKRSVFVNILMKNDMDTNRAIAKKRCEWVYDTYTAILNTIQNDNAAADVDSIIMTLSMRTCIGALENMYEGSHPVQAVIDSIIGKIAETDLEVAESCKAILLSRPEPNFVGGKK